MTGGFSDEQGSSVANNFSLVMGGPLYRALARIGLFQPGHHTRRTFAWLALTWLPLLALSIAEGTAWGHKVRIPLLYDFSAYSRFLVALPLLIAAEAVIDPFIRNAVFMLSSSGIVRKEDLPAFEATLARTARLRDSAVIELLLALVACVPFFLWFADYQWVSNQVSVWHGTTLEGLTAAGWWFAFVDSPVLRFLMFRWLWRYALWSYVLRKISTLNLDLLPTHPDRLGGLGLLVDAQQQFGLLAAALGWVIAGQFANEILHFGKPLSEISAPAGVFVAISILLVLLPLTLLSPNLFRARRDGIVRYHLVAGDMTSTFDVRWARRGGSPPAAMVGSQDPSSLIDYISTYDVVRETQVIPIRKRSVAYIAALAAAPFFSVWLLATPFDRLIAEIIKRLL